ncbi:hypothetical protein [Algoriphagus winogradskyi]|uniref:Uncharacterized protein n=1 Tax=Algoriphagus winogradskyi TaxID=237017 RepID=A0ABY1PHC2_9BACT|nr:hypothetical protein [Algoriphagus winogradskyi]SMP33335.1 hypothetical protein SAMN06265367_108158 [Algoriphagus winogradskyi]
MINYFRKVFTGYKRVEKVVEGMDTTFFYMGQLVRFSPITMIKELRFKQVTEKFTQVSSKLSITEILDRIGPNSGLANAKIKVHIKEDNTLLKVHRHVTKIGNFNTSYYEFYIEDELVAVFLRKYDYGRSFASTISKIHPEIVITSVKSGEKYLFNHQEEGNQVIAEFFGHTQIWVIVKGIKLNKLIDNWGLNYSQKKELA